MSIGEDRVRTEFNPSKSDTVSQIKQKSAELINMCRSIMDMTTDPDVGRCCSLAMTDYEKAAMWAVKAATHPKIAGGEGQQQK